METIENKEQQGRVEIRLTENHHREAAHIAFERLRMMDGVEPDTTPILLPQEHPMETIFHGNVLPDTHVSPTKGVSSYEKALLEMGSYEEVFELRRRRHCDLEGVLRGDILREEDSQIAFILSRCTRSLQVLVDTIYNLPQDMIELQLCKLYDHERLEYRLRPAVRGEQHGRDVEAVFEIEERMRIRHMFSENLTFQRLYTRFNDVLASIIAFSKAQAIIRLGLDSQSGIENTYFDKWMKYAAIFARKRRINVGLRRIVQQVRKSLLRDYSQKWNGPRQRIQFEGQQEECFVEERELRQELVLNEEEVRDRSIFEAMEKTEFQALFDEHFDEFEPLSRERKQSASAELEMLNAARHAKWRLLCLYKHMVRVQGESKATFLAQLTMQYTVNRRLMCWRHWAERTAMVRSLIREHRTTTLQLREETQRHALILHQTHLRQRLLTKARSRPVLMQEVQDNEERAHLLRIRHRFVAWLYFISQNNPQAESAILQSETLRRMKLRYFTKFVRFRKRRRDASAALVVRWRKAANLISMQVDEFQHRIALEARQELIPLQHILIHRRKADLLNKQLPEFTLHLMRQRLHTLAAFRVQQQHRQYALSTTLATSTRLVVERYTTQWQLFSTPPTAVATMMREAEEEDDLFTKLTVKYRADTAYLVAEEKYQQATALLTITNTRLRMYAYYRFVGLVVRRKLARSKKGVAIAMAEQLEKVNVAVRYLHRWKKVCARKRLGLTVAEKGMACSMDLLRRYFANFRPPSVRRSKVCRAKKNLIAAREAAENTATLAPAHATGVAAGELAHVVLPLRRRARLLPPL